VTTESDETTDAQRFAALYEHNYADVLRFLVRRTTTEAAEDVAHEAFLVAWRRLDIVPETAVDARAWLFKTARNCLLASYRGQSQRNALAVRLAQVSDAVEPGDESWGALVDVSRAWDQLSDQQQETISLAAFDGLESAEAGRVLGISAATYRLRLFRARNALRAALNPEAPSHTPIHNEELKS